MKRNGVVPCRLPEDEFNIHIGNPDFQGRPMRTTTQIRKHEFAEGPVLQVCKGDENEACIAAQPIEPPIESTDVS